MSKDTGEAKALGQIVEIDEQKIHDHLGEMVCGTVGETLNQLLEAEAEALCNAARYKRADKRRDYRSGSYRRRLNSKAGRVELNDAEAAATTLRDRASCVAVAFILH